MDLTIQAMNKIFRQIPKQVLDICYGARADTYTSINMVIENNVIKGEVFNDLNLMSCNQLVVKLSSLEKAGVYGDKKIYNIPGKITNNLPVISVTAVVDDNMYFGGKTDMAVPTSVRASILNRHSITIDTTDEEYMMDGSVELMLAYDDRLKEVDPISYPEIIKGIVLAVKADIYNELVISLDSGALYYGHSIDSIKSKVDEYADAREAYETHLEEVLGKVLFMNSDELMTDYVTAMMPNAN